MKKYIVLLLLKVKSAFVALPQIIAGTILFSVIFGVAAFGLYTLEDVSGQNELLKIAIVYPEESKFSKENVYTRKAFEFLGQMEGVKSICTFVDYEDEEIARTDLRRGDVAAVVVIPQGFLKSILNGENRPARVIFKQNSNAMSSDVFMEMIRAGASDLSTAQAGVYAIEDVCKKYGIDFEDSLNVNIDINTKYLSYALNRGEYFEIEEIKTGYNNLNTAQIYASFAIVLVILISSTTCVGLISSDSVEVNQALRIRGVITGTSHCFNVIGVSLVYWAIFGLVYLFMGLAVVRFPELGTFFTFMGNPESSSVYDVLNENAWSNLGVGIVMLLILMSGVFAFAGFIFKLTDKTIAGVLVLLLLVMVMVFLPDTVMTPFVTSVRLCGQIIAGCVEVGTVMVSIAYTVAFLAGAALIDVYRGKRRV